MFRINCLNAELVSLWEFHLRGTAVHRRWNVLLEGPLLVYILCTYIVMKSTIVVTNLVMYKYLYVLFRRLRSMVKQGSSTCSTIWPRIRVAPPDASLINRQGLWIQVRYWCCYWWNKFIYLILTWDKYCSIFLKYFQWIVSWKYIGNFFYPRYI